MIYHVFANRSNIGDWLSARGIQSQLASHRIRETLCDEPFVAESIRVLAGATEKDLVIIGGGGLFMDYFQAFWSGFDEISRRVPFCIWGVGICDFKEKPTRLAEPLLGQIAGRSRLCVVRDQLTWDALWIADLPAPIPCPCLLLPPRPLPRKRNAVLHAVHFEVLGEDAYDAQCALVRDYAVRHRNDYLETNNEVPQNNLTALNSELGLYERAGVVVSSRLHGCILGLMHGCKVIAVSGDRKVESFMNAAGLGNWICELRDLSALRDRLADHDRQRPPVEFLDGARRENIAVGRRVSEIVRQIQADGAEH